MKPRILIVEDNYDNRLLLTWRLHKIGDFDIQEATNGREALVMMAASPPDCVLMDLKMPELDGWAVARSIRASESDRHVPIIAVTAQAMVGDEQKALAAGCDAYITKPLVDYARFAEIIMTLLAQRGASSAAVPSSQLT